MDRTTARELWARAAKGDLAREQDDPVDLQQWIREVAQAVLEADAQPGAERPDAMLRAVGLAGKRDPYAELSRFTNLLYEFCPYDEDGVEVPQTHGQKIRNLLELARDSGLLHGVYAIDDKKAIDLIRSLLPKQK